MSSVTPPGPGIRARRRPSSREPARSWFPGAFRHLVGLYQSGRDSESFGDGSVITDDDRVSRREARDDFALLAIVQANADRLAVYLARADDIHGAFSLVGLFDEAGRGDRQ